MPCSCMPSHRGCASRWERYCCWTRRPSSPPLSGPPWGSGYGAFPACAAGWSGHETAGSAAGHVIGPADHMQPAGWLTPCGQPLAEGGVVPADDDRLDVRAAGQDRGHRAVHSPQGHRAGAHGGHEPAGGQPEAGPRRRRGGRGEGIPDRQRARHHRQARLSPGRHRHGGRVHDVRDVEVVVQPGRMRAERRDPGTSRHGQLAVPPQPAQPGTGQRVGGDDHVGAQRPDPRCHAAPERRPQAAPGRVEIPPVPPHRGEEELIHPRQMLHLRHVERPGRRGERRPHRGQGIQPAHLAARPGPGHRLSQRPPGRVVALANIRAHDQRAPRRLRLIQGAPPSQAGRLASRSPSPATFPLEQEIHPAPGSIS